MFVITGKSDNLIYDIGIELDYMDNGYPRIVEKNIAYPDSMVNVHEVESIPDGIEPYKYSYTKDNGFQVNEDYKEPVNEEAERIKVLESENTLLKAQINALADNQEFIEDCLIEVGQVVYA